MKMMTMVKIVNRGSAASPPVKIYKYLSMDVS